MSNLLTIGLYNYAANQPGGSGASFAFILLWMPAVWGITIILTIFLILKRRKRLFVNGTTKWTVATLLFCTPIPLYLSYRLTHPTPETLLSGGSYTPKDGKIYKSENWYYTSNYRQRYVDMYFVADSIEERSKGENAYKKDSTWIYFTRTGDTLKVENYKNGQLISSKQYANK
ncbi:hypothetical protein [Arachidicoccus terrestris]|uniref:hypothetical protein n=1 Tax=Arachidicoccus terrestris TaxID=2875539 RepID=UPI001CC68595|nr:hypothetical protein [Arachidicoccus terrestris]UAY56223.1 hypothetical protein K9M52_04185 [Arachidicoccus terrestris]